MKCQICGKTPQFGHNVSHSKRRTNRMWMPNIHPVTVDVEGKPTRMTLCTRCIRTINKPARKQQQASQA
ncbi:MAG: 50S ribosomal protein L28 [Dehalococcoidales bacterium]|nr:50S ribosomal protein L28 [Dehalococcoidales bacterium]